MIQGGWKFVWAAYGLSWIFLGLYALSLGIRLRRLSKREKENS